MPNINISPGLGDPENTPTAPAVDLPKRDDQVTFSKWGQQLTGTVVDVHRSPDLDLPATRIEIITDSHGRQFAYPRDLIGGGW